MSPARPRHQRPTALKTFLFGTPYYPEHWTPVDRQRDAELMSKAGMNVVRMAEFAWDRMEPTSGAYDFSLFDETIKTLGVKGVNTILCTPTATPPKWLTVKHLEWMRVNATDIPMEHGSRQHCCTNNGEFRAESRRITRAMAEHYAGNPHVIGWQTDNELFCHISECFCDGCLARFQKWLRAAYNNDITALNTSWGCAFWALTYSDFSQIGFPRLPERPTHPNPHQMLDYGRFLSDGLTEFQKEQIDILRAANPKWWITHNGMFWHIDYWKFSQDLDFLGYDMYPGFNNNGPLSAADWSHGLSRCRAAGGNFVIPETQGGAGGQRPYLHETPRPGQMRLWAYQEVAQGADGILHFRWRSCRFGAEMYWNGILDHDNIPRRRYEEFSQEGAELQRLGPTILGTVSDVKLAALIDQDQEEAHHSMTLGLPSPNDQGLQAYRQFWKRHLPGGMVDYRDSFDGLSMIIIPSHILIDEATAARLEAFVRDGGTLVATARTATRDRRNHVLSITPPGHLSHVFGVTVEEFGKQDRPGVALRLSEKKSVKVPAYEILKLAKGAKPLATWTTAQDKGPHAAVGTCAMAVNRLGKGTAIYIGTYFTDDNAEAIFDVVLKHVKVAPLANAIPGVEVSCRIGENRRLLFVLNHHAKSQEVTGLPKGTELISGKKCAGSLTVKAFDVAIIEAKK